MYAKLAHPVDNIWTLTKPIMCSSEGMDWFLTPSDMRDQKAEDELCYVQRYFNFVSDYGSK